jgi:predicted mannosyl-3-phosphoglycerate phosphatase (HAD superfamily)
MNPAAGIIFSDLDGTFVDASGQPALTPAEFARVLEHWRVVWVSSRTVDELLHFQRTLGHEGDAIGEDGGVLLCREQAVAAALGSAKPLDEAWVVERASPYQATLARVRRAFADQGIDATTMRDLGVAELTKRGIAPDAAERALHRRASVLLANVDRDDLRARRALRALRVEGCAVANGGRWVSVVHGADKGTTAKAWLKEWSAQHPDQGAIIIAIGNADNDESLLRTAHRAYVVRAPGGTYAARLAGISNAHLLSCAGNAGWAEMVERLDSLPEHAS